MSDRQVTSEVDDHAMDAIDDVKTAFLKEMSAVALHHARPSVLYRPTLERAANNWKVNYGGLIVYGTTPQAAMSNFDAEWFSRQARR